MTSVVTVDEVNRFLDEQFGASRNRCESVGDGEAVAVLFPDEASLRPGGIISGPSVFGLCDGALYYAVFTVVGIEPMALTSELSIRFLRPAIGEVVRARATLHHRGRRSLVGTVVAWTDDEARPVAVAQGTYVRPR